MPCEHQRNSSICAVASKYGNLWTSSEFEAFLQGATAEQVEELRCAFEDIRLRRHAEAISRWIDYTKEQKANISQSERQFAQQLGRLLVLFRILGENRRQPFVSEEVRYIEPVRVPNWSNLPDELHYLRKPAEEYRRLIDEANVVDALAFMTPEETESLSALAATIHANDHMKRIEDWRRAHPLAKHEEAAMIYRVLMVLDLAGLL